MKIYIAGGFALMNGKGREKKMKSLISNYHRLISYYDYIRKNRIMNVFNLKKT